MDRRLFLGFGALPALAWAQAGERGLPSSPLDAVAAYVLPTDQMPEALAAAIARALTQETGLWIKAALWSPSDVDQPLPGSNQYAAEDYFRLGARLAPRLPDAGPRTYFIVLTERDINLRAQNFRFQYSAHSPMARTSVLSIARLRYDMDGRPAAPDVVASRLQKMLMRIVGEMKLGWKRVSDPTDLMYAPIMSVEDIDRMSLIHTLQSRRDLK